MGFISRYKTLPTYSTNSKAHGFAREAVDRGRSLWRQTFDLGTDKESALSKFPRVRDRQSWTRGVIAEPAAFKRLLQAMRSMAPGGWSDDRWEQVKHQNGIVYAAIHRKCEQLGISEFQVFKKDHRLPDGKRPITPSDPEEGGRPVRPYALVELLQNPNNDDSWGEMMYCFPPGTRVRMADGSHKPIEKIQLNEKVLTAEGNIRKVRQCHARPYKGDLVTIKSWGHGHLRCTPNHSVLTKRGYIPAGELTNSDWIAIPRFMPVDRSGVLQTANHVGGETCLLKAYTKDKRYAHPDVVKPSTSGTPWANYKKVPDFIGLTPEFGRIVGLYLAEGFTGKNSVTWSLGAHEVDTIVADLVKLLHDELGLEARVHIVGKRKSVALVVINGKMWIRLFRSLCGAGAGGKRLHPDLLAGPDEFLAGVLRGWLEGDGCIKKRGGTVNGASVSHDLLLNMYDIANHLGMRPSINLEKTSGKERELRIDGELQYKIKTKMDTWKLNIRSDSDNYRVLLENGVMWRRVHKIEKIEYDGDVYNLGVEDDNSYVAEGVGVHNCWNQQMDLTGMALTWMVPNKLGIPYELYVIPTAIAIPQPAINPDYPDGYYRIQPIYPYGPFSSYPTPATAVGAPIPAQWMLRFKYPHPLLRYDGLSPLTALRLHIDEVEAMDRSRWYTMHRLINPSAILNFREMEGMEPLPEAEIERIRAEFEENFQGPENSGRLFVAAPGSELTIQEARLRDLEFRDGWNQLVEFIHGAGFGISKTAAGMVESSTYSVLFATLKQMHMLTLDPQCKRISRYLTKHLAPFFGDDLIIEVRTPRIDDHDIRNAALQLLVNAKAITKNETREALEYSLTQEQWGDEIAGTESQAMMPGMGGMPGMGMPGMGGGMGGGEGAPVAEGGTPFAGPGTSLGQPPPVDRMFPQSPSIGPSERQSVMPEPPSIAGSRPRPGKLSRGGQGPRKGLYDHYYKKLMHTNGNGHTNGTNQNE